MLNPGVESDAYPDVRAGAQVKALVVEMHAGDDLDGDDRRDCPIDDETEGSSHQNASGVAACATPMTSPAATGARSPARSGCASASTLTLEQR
jgi:hypothetical protein